MKKRYVISFPPGKIDTPITYTLIKDFDLEINILNADISSGKTGNLVVEIDAEVYKLEAGIKFIEQNGVHISEVKKQLLFKQESCIACGSCTAVCFSGALSMNKDNWDLNFDASECVVCGLCIKACPLKLFNLDINANV